MDIISKPAGAYLHVLGKEFCISMYLFSDACSYWKLVSGMYLYVSLYICMYWYVFCMYWQKRYCICMDLYQRCFIDQINTYRHADTCNKTETCGLAMCPVVELACTSSIVCSQLCVAGAICCSLGSNPIRISWQRAGGWFGVDPLHLRCSSSRVALGQRACGCPRPEGHGKVLGCWWGCGQWTDERLEEAQEARGADWSRHGPGSAGPAWVTYPLWRW
jgi:hypothetical protein